MTERLPATPLRCSQWVTPGFHLAVCMDCRPVRPLPFFDVTERDQWAEVHAGIGHAVERVDPETPPPADITRNQE